MWVGGMTSTTSHNTHSTMTTTFTTPLTDQELQLDTLATISGGGKKAKTKVGKWLEKTFGDGDGEHEFGDYADEVIKIITIVSGGKKAGNVHQPPGEEAPGPNVWY